MWKCINCIWEGEVTEGPLNHCPSCGDKTVFRHIHQHKAKEQFESVMEAKRKEQEEKKKKSIFDLNNDGKVDKKDLKLAAKTLKTIGSKFARRKK